MKILSNYRLTNLLIIFILTLSGLCAMIAQTNISFSHPEITPSYSENINYLNTITAPSEVELTSVATTTQFPTVNRAATTTAARPKCAYAELKLNANNSSVCIDGTGRPTTYVPDSQVAWMTGYGYGAIGANKTYLYGHNYAGIFGNLKNSTSFTITLTATGEVLKYQIVTSKIYCYQNCSDQSVVNQSTMLYVIDPAQHIDTAGKNSISLMTCHNPGNTHRLVAYAIQI